MTGLEHVRPAGDLMACPRCLFPEIVASVPAVVRVTRNGTGRVLAAPIALHATDEVRCVKDGCGWTGIFADLHANGPRSRPMSMAAISATLTAAYASMTDATVYVHGGADYTGLVHTLTDYTVTLKRADGSLGPTIPLHSVRRATRPPSCPAVGQHVTLTRAVDRYPHFIANAGRTGTVREATGDLVRVVMHSHLHGAEEWDNEVCWSREDDAQPDGRPDARRAAARDLKLQLADVPASDA